MSTNSIEAHCNGRFLYPTKVVNLHFSLSSFSPAICSWSRNRILFFSPLHFISRCFDKHFLAFINIYPLEWRRCDDGSRTKEDGRRLLWCLRATLRFFDFGETIHADEGKQGRPRMFDQVGSFASQAGAAAPALVFRFSLSLLSHQRQKRRQRKASNLFWLPAPTSAKRTETVAKKKERKTVRSKLTFSGRTCLGSWRRRCERIYLSLYWVCTRTRSWSHSSITTIDV